jgi:hypothetical protein
MHLLDQLEGQRPAPIQDSGDASSATDVWFQISSREPAAPLARRAITRRDWAEES